MEYSQTIELENTSPDGAFQIAEKAIQEVGFEIWKTRPIGWLIIANQSGGGGLQATICIRPGGGAAVNIALKGDADEAAMQAIADQFFAGVQSQSE